jgi:hypothetical protein
MPQVDYSESYEKTRVSCGYPRVSGKELERLQREIAEKESDFIREIETLSSIDRLTKGLQFIEKRRDCSTPVKSTKTYYRRALLLTHLILQRLESHYRSEQDVIFRAEQCLDWLCGCIRNAKLELKADIVMKFELFAWKVCLWLKIPCDDKSDAIGCLENVKATRIHAIITRKTAGQKRALMEG